MYHLFEGPLHEMEPIPDTAWVTENLRLDSPGTYGKTKYYCSKKKKKKKYSDLLIGQCLAQPSSEKLPPAADESKY